MKNSKQIRMAAETILKAFEKVSLSLKNIGNAAVEAADEAFEPPETIEDDALTALSEIPAHDLFFDIALEVAILSRGERNITVEDAEVARENIVPALRDIVLEIRESKVIPTSEMPSE